MEQFAGGQSLVDKSMKGYKNSTCSCVETELIELCKEYLNEQFDQAILRERITALVNAKYDASEYSFAYMLLCGYMNLFSEYEPDEWSFRSNVEKVLSEIENEPYISETWLVRLEETENENINLLYECWNRSEGGDLKNNERIYRELGRIEKSKIQCPASIRDIIYNSIISFMSMWDPSSADIWVNHAIGADTCQKHKTGDKLNDLFDIWYGKEKLFFQFNYIAGDIYICML